MNPSSPKHRHIIEYSPQLNLAELHAQMTRALISISLFLKQVIASEIKLSRSKVHEVLLMAMMSLVGCSNLDFEFEVVDCNNYESFPEFMDLTKQWSVNNGDAVQEEYNLMNPSPERTIEASDLIDTMQSEDVYCAVIDEDTLKEGTLGVSAFMIRFDSNFGKKGIYFLPELRHPNFGYEDTNSEIIQSLFYLRGHSVEEWSCLSGGSDEMKEVLTDYGLIKGLFAESWYHESAHFIRPFIHHKGNEPFDEIMYWGYAAKNTVFGKYNLNTGFSPSALHLSDEYCEQVRREYPEDITEDGASN